METVFPVKDYQLKETYILLGLSMARIMIFKKKLEWEELQFLVHYYLQYFHFLNFQICLHTHTPARL